MATCNDMPGNRVTISATVATPTQDNSMTTKSMNDDSVVRDSPIVVKVCMLKSVSTFSVPNKIEEMSVEALVDCGAEVTIISDRVYSSMKRQPKKLRDVRLDTAGRQMSIHGFIAGPFSLTIGESPYKGPLYVAPIEQDMLMGIDILHKGSAILDMGKGTLTYDDFEIDMNVRSTEGLPQVARVTVSKRRVIPPNSVIQLQCAMDARLPDYVIEPCFKSDIFGPRVLRKAGSDPVVCIANPTDCYKLLKKGQVIARAYPVEIDSIDSRTDLAPEHLNVNAVSETPTTDEVTSQVPDHLKEAYQSSVHHLTDPERVRLAELLTTFEDVFAKMSLILEVF